MGYRVASRENKLTKPELGHLKKHSAPALRNLREFKVRAAFHETALELEHEGQGYSRCMTKRVRVLPTYPQAACRITGLWVIYVQPIVAAELYTGCWRYAARHPLRETEGDTRLVQVKELKEEYVAGQQLNVDDMFKAGDLVDIAGTTIGKGFQGGHCVAACLQWFSGLAVPSLAV